jgi:class 3 adenylate cyclase
VDRQRTRYAKSGAVHVAYQVLGDGPTDLVYVQGAFTHLDVMWELPAFRRFCEQLASFTRLIWFDKRGMGLSDRVAAGTLEERMDDVRAVMDAAGSGRAVLLGESEGGPLSMLFAAAHPERAAGLILCGAEVKERTDEDWPWGEDTAGEFEQAMASLPDRWGGGQAIGYIAPSLAGDAQAREWLGRVQMNAATPGAAETFMRMAFDIDVRDVAPAIRVPALVIHRVDDQVCHVENARFLARRIPGATYVELPGADHAPWVGGDEIVAEIREFVTGVREPAEPDRVLATVLFTDIVASTEHARQLGDRLWRDLVSEHHDLIRRELARFRGREIDTAGDGFLAAFDGPARALRAAQSIVRAVRPLGIQVRAGVHTGECEILDDKLVGVAVHVGARVAAAAGPSEVLATGTVRDLVAGSGIEFADRGMRPLKGLPDQWRLFSVLSTR